MIDQLIKHRSRLLCIGFGVMYFWFGALKFFPGLSPAEALAKATLDKLTLGLISSNISYTMLAIWEVTIGIFMLLNRPKRWIIYLTALHLLFTFTPLFLLPETTFGQPIYSLTLVGQYIIKNIALFAALLFLWQKKEAGNH